MKITSGNTGITDNPVTTQVLPFFIAPTYCSLLRLDTVHPIISGNKWYKLRYFIDEAKANQSEGIRTFGGIWSNHLPAAAFAAHLAGLKSIGIVNAHQRATTETLKKCVEYGMHIQWLPRAEWNNLNKEPFIYDIPEGGSGPLGIKGAADIAKFITSDFTHVCVSVGTGTTLSGLLNALNPSVHVLGFAPMKGGQYLKNEILQNIRGKRDFPLFDHWHFGGFGRMNQELHHFMNDFKQAYDIELDRVYTAKMMYGVKQLAEENFFPPDAKVCCIHTGGLQGNKSLDVFGK